MASILLDQVPQLRREVNRAKIVVSQTATASFELSIPEPGTSDHIRPFFWVPSDVTEEQLPRIVEKNIALCWLQMANPKNGGWKPVVQPKGWSYDKVESLWKWNKGTKLNIAVMHVVFPPDHPTPQHNFIKERVLPCLSVYSFLSTHIPTYLSSVSPYSPPCTSFQYL